jgi:glycosyltransferase involved in cell wall biosynthesis
MDLCADQLLAHLPAAAPGVLASDVDPPFRRRFTLLPVIGRRNGAFNADRLLNRHVFLSRVVRRQSSAFDLFHIADHSYAHLVHALTPGRAGVYCHDLDAFRCLLEPAADPRPWWFRRIARRILTGLRRAAVVFYSTGAVRDQFLRHELVDPARLVHAPYGVAEEFTPAAAGGGGPPAGVPDGPYVLHVGTNTPRKRLDVLLDVFAAVRGRVPGLRLVQVGGPWPPDLAARIDRLKVADAVTQVRGLTRGQLADLYRRAEAVLVPSEAEGFGLPVIEALACGAAVVATDLPVLREVGGDAVVFRPVAAVEAWADAVAAVLTDPAFAPPRDTRLTRAARYSWHEHARVIAQAYLNLT